MAFRKKILLLASKISLESGTYTGVTPSDPEYMILDPVVTEGWSMHEIGVVRQVLRTVEAFAKENELDMIDTIVLEIGDLSLVIPKYVEDIYKVIIKDTPFENTKLKIEVVEAQGICRDCKRAFPIVKNEGYCPRCGKRNADVISGRDFIVKEVIVP